MTKLIVKTAEKNGVEFASLGEADITTYDVRAIYRT